jgi:hypothetical protein
LPTKIDMSGAGGAARAPRASEASKSKVVAHRIVSKKRRSCRPLMTFPSVM